VRTHFAMSKVVPTRAMLTTSSAILIGDVKAMSRSVGRR
jgi:hypothetical protein